MILISSISKNGRFPCIVFPKQGPIFFLLSSVYPLSLGPDKFILVPRFIYFFRFMSNISFKNRLVELQDIYDNPPKFIATPTPKN
jgi:hypothetical protein